MSTESLAVVATGFAVFALVVVVALAVHVGRLTRTYDALVGGDDSSSFVRALGRQSATADALRAEVEQLRAQVHGMRAALRHVAVVRYDAFSGPLQGTGGALSFSAALLDDAGNGLVLTSINGRSETRTYAKGVRGGSGELELSPEELEAVATARATTQAGV